MAVKILVNGEAGSGKTELLRSFGEETLVISRDAKEFALPIPHMLVDVYYDMTTLIYGADMDTEDSTSHVDGIVDKMNAYTEAMGKLPKNVVIDSVSQITMDVIDKASQSPNVYGSQSAEITKEMAMLTQFIHEELELNNINVVLLNHVIAEKVEGNSTGAYTQFGQGKFLAKGGFYATTNEAVTIVPEGQHRVVYTRGMDKQARTSMKDFPSKLYIENIVDPTKSRKLRDSEYYFNLSEYLDRLLEVQSDIKTFRL